ncbi:glycosyltransferase family 4 protein [Sphingomonas sp. J315]|uniref:glycosyltransferase family 4 protein n=1 Tax=Sphingomonas sp. J315 TaxID=2898433 RepID=UPI0021AE309E|nr:glycosyltransferase family 4 protein [Sphingomonas sp. J315]UUY00562.1 glycosyltransferase family 4 protein [Sphingomonas sp. J315]
MQMKIVMLCEFFNEELEFQENLLVKYYRRHGHDVTVIASLFESVFDYYEDRAPKGGEHREYQHEGARIIKLPFRFNLLNRVRPYVSIRTILEEAKPDLIFVHDIMPNLPECIAYVKANPQTRMIMDYHADYSNSGKNWVSLKILHGVIRKWYLDRARPYLQKIFPIVPAGFEFLEQVYRVPMHEMELLPLGTDLEYGVAITEAGGGAAVRKRLGIPADAFTVFTGGKLSRNRRTEHLIDAVRRICRDDLHVIIAGAPPPQHVEYAEMLKDRALGMPNVHFVGWQDKKGMYEHMDASDVGVFPGGQSVLWQQAIGMGLPLLLVDRSEQIRGHQDARYLNRHGNVVILDPETTSQQIEQWLRDLIDDRARLAEMSEGARRTAAEMLDWNVLIDTTLRFNRAGNGKLGEG